MMLRTMLMISLLFLFHLTADAQEKLVAITLDDFLLAFDSMDIGKLEEASASLLNSITMLHIPVTIFVNESSLMNAGEAEKRLAIYEAWIQNPFITVGNHTYSHKNYADTPLSLFEEDVLSGETLTKEQLKNSAKTLKYFRFPFNCTGRDLDSRTAIYNFLKSKGYSIVPFTIESLDYIYNTLYHKYLTKGDEKKAQEILMAYLNFTLDIFEYFEGVSHKFYRRDIRHIFLGHTNELHVACFEELITRLQQRGYRFVSLDDALEDEVYQQKDFYTEHFGISWMYRWIENSDVRMVYMKNEPFPDEIFQQYNKLE